MLKCLHTTACLQSNPWEEGKEERGCLNFGVLLSKGPPSSQPWPCLKASTQRNPTAHSPMVIPSYRVKPEREKQISFIKAYMWSLEKWCR